MKILHSENNKGFSLIELLVALAISSIVFSALSVLISTAVKGYTTQTAEAKLQSDGNITMNQISDNIMEANMIELSKILVSGGVGTDATDIRIKTRDNNVYYYNSDKQEIYLLSDSSKKPGRDADFTDYSLVCANVKAFDVRILKDSFKLDNDNKITGINTLQIKLSMTINRAGSERSISKIAYVRNTITIKEGAGIVNGLKLQLGGVLNSIETNKSLDDDDVKIYIE